MNEAQEFELRKQLQTAIDSKDEVAEYRIRKQLSGAPVEQPQAQEQQPQSQSIEQQIQGSSVLGSVSDAAKPIVLAGPSEVASGLAGLAGAVLPGPEGQGAEWQRQTSEYLGEKSAPKTEGGKKAFETFGDFMSWAGDKIKDYPVAGIAGLIDAVNTVSEAGLLGAIEQGGQTVRDMQNAPSFSEGVRDITGSDAAALAADVVPAGVATLAGGKAAYNLSKTPQGRTGLPQEQRQGIEPRQDAIEGELMPPEGISQQEMQRSAWMQTPEQQRAGEALVSGERTRETAGYELVPEKGSAFVRRVKEDEVAMNEGWEAPTIADINADNNPTNAAKLRMLAIRERSMKSDVESVKNRPTDVAGSELNRRVNDVITLNREAGRRLDSEANKLKGQSINVNDVVDEFRSGLEELGVKLEVEEDGVVRPNFAGSDLEDIKGAENLVKRIVARMNKGDGMDAYEAHRLKRYIDETVSYGKSAEGLTGSAERLIKSLRRNIDQRLDENFDSYNQVNTQYADTISAIDSLQSNIGRKIDLTADNASSALGTELNKLMSNYSTRTGLENAINDIDAAAGKYGRQYDINLTSLVKFANRIDERMGTKEATTSLQGRVERGSGRAADAAASTSVTGRILKEGKDIYQDVTMSGRKKQQAQYEADLKALNAMRAVLRKRLGNDE